MEFSEMCCAKPQDLNNKWLRMENLVINYASSLCNKGITDIMTSYNSDNNTACKYFTCS